MKLVLVSCCAPCSAGAIKQLADGEIPDVDDFVVLFFNPNIYPWEEYQRRLTEQIRYCDALGVRHVELEYDHDAWRAAVRGLESEPERGARCSACFRFRFARAAAWAMENGYDTIASVLGVSRHKDQAQVDRAGFAVVNNLNGHPPSPDGATPRPGGGHYAATGDGGMAKIHTSRYSKIALQQSKVLKRRMTDAERLLWHYLRGRKDFSFRKQAPIGNYIVDFVCLSKKLVIELDGDQHGDSHHRPHDAERDEFLQASGFRVLRFWNDEVFKNIDTVLDTIYQYLARPCLGGDNCAVSDNDPIPTAWAGGVPAAPRADGRGVAMRYLPVKWDENLRVQINRASDFYRQNYCGCEFSRRPK